MYASEEVIAIYNPAFVRRVWKKRSEWKRIFFSHSHGGYRKALRPDELGPRQEELLSYLIGLGPVGTPIEVDAKILMRDLGFSARAPYYVALQRLIARKHVLRLRNGSAGSTGLLVVLGRGGL